MTVDKGEEADRGTRGRLPRHVRAAGARGSVTDFDLSQLYDDSKALNEDALTIPGYSMDGWYGRILRGCGFFDPDQADPQVHQEGAARPPPGADQDQGRRHQPDVRGPDPGRSKSMLSKDVDALQPHVRAFVERVVTFTTCPRAGSRLNEAARSSKIEEATSPTSARCRSATWPTGSRAWTNRRWLRCSPGSNTSTRSRRSGWDTSRSTGRRAACPG